MCNCWTLCLVVATTIYSYNRPIIKTIHYVVNITSTKAKLFTIRCRINQAISIPNVKYIVIITDFLYMAKKIFNSLIHPYQIHSIAISQELRDFFKKNSNNHIDFWDCSSKQKWIPYFKNINVTLFPWCGEWTSKCWCQSWKWWTLIIFIFFFIFIFFSIYFSIFQFLELRVRVSHIVQRKRVERSKRMMSYNIHNIYWS